MYQRIWNTKKKRTVQIDTIFLSKSPIRQGVLLQESRKEQRTLHAVTSLPLNLKHRISVLIDPMTFLKGRNIHPTSISGLDRSARRCRPIAHFHQPATVPVTGPDEGHLLQFSAY